MALDKSYGPSSSRILHSRADSDVLLAQSTQKPQKSGHIVRATWGNTSADAFANLAMATAFDSQLMANIAATNQMLLLAQLAHKDADMARL
jgi:hypothetical protein